MPPPRSIHAKKTRPSQRAKTNDEVIVAVYPERAPLPSRATTTRTDNLLSPFIKWSHPGSMVARLHLATVLPPTSGCICFVLVFVCKTILLLLCKNSSNASRSSAGARTATLEPQRPHNKRSSHTQAPSTPSVPQSKFIAEQSFFSPSFPSREIATDYTDTSRTSYGLRKQQPRVPANAERTCAPQTARHQPTSPRFD